MNNSQVAVAIFSGLFALAIQGRAQTVYQVTFKGTIETTNGTGDIVSEKLSDQSYIADAMTALGITNGVSADALDNAKTNKTVPPSFSLVYVQNASTDPSATGDFVEVMENNGTNSALVYTNVQFMYGGSFPPALTNSSQTAYVAGAQVIPLPLAGSGQSLGGATINERAIKNKTLISGSFNYVSLRPAGATDNDSISVYGGTFNVGKQISP